MDTIHVPRLLLQLGFTRNQPTGSVWESKGGIRLTAYGHHGVPYRWARVIVLYLAEKARESGEVVTGTLGDIRAHYELSWTDRTLREYFQRVVECIYEVSEQAPRCCPRECLSYRPLRFIRAYRFCPHTKRFMIEVYPEFVKDARSGVKCSRDIIMRLIQTDHFSVLDLYVWFQARLQDGDLQPVDICGPDGPYALITSAKSPARMRQQMAETEQILRSVWPECPFRIVAKGRKLAHVDTISELLEADREPRNDQRKPLAVKLNPALLDLSQSEALSEGIAALKARLAAMNTEDKQEDTEADLPKMA